MLITTSPEFMIDSANNTFLQVRAVSKKATGEGAGRKMILGFPSSHGDSSCTVIGLTHG